VIEPPIICPNCSHEIKLTESLAAPLIEETRKRLSEQLAAKDAEVSKKEAALRVQQGEVARSLESIEDQITARLEAGLRFCCWTSPTGRAEVFILNWAEWLRQ
jgi:hypothetical protein